jgi:hypothetical protein
MQTEEKYLTSDMEASLSLDVAPAPPHLSTHYLYLLKTHAAHSSLFMQFLSLLSLHSSLFTQLSLHSSLPPTIHQGKWATSSFFNGTKREYTPYSEYKKVAGRRLPQRRLLQRVRRASFLHGAPCCS